MDLGMTVSYNFLWWTFLRIFLLQFCSRYTVKNKEFVIDAVDWKITKRFRENNNNNNNEREKNYFIAIVCQVVCFIGTRRIEYQSNNKTKSGVCVAVLALVCEIRVYNLFRVIVCMCASDALFFAARLQFYIICKRKI